ncbi:hypothetical protein HOH67_05555 [Candidatus Peregrinibacteria bacterium]|jgi:hypothetical protein|nr:hypothetical protein [Candidatus Peregrinibacteria bacterium]
MKTGLKTCLAFLGLSVLGIFVFVFFVFGSTAKPVKVSEEFFTELSSGEISAAYEDTSVLFKENTNLELFEQFLVQFPILTDTPTFTFPSRFIGTENGVTYSDVSGTVTGTNGDSMQIEMHLVKEGKDWKVSGFNLAPILDQ